MTDIKVVVIEEKEDTTDILHRMPVGLKSWVSGKAQELGYTRTAYINAVLTTMMEADNE